MTEQEMKKAIRDCDHKISTEFESLRSAAYSVGKAGLDAAKSEQANAVSDASRSTTAATVFPLVFALAGFFLFAVNWFFAICLIAGGIFASYKLHEKTAYDQYKVEQSYSQMLSTVHAQAQNLTDVINRNQKI